MSKSLWETLKKGLVEGFQVASDKTSEYTRIGRLKIDVLGIKKEIEEKFIELGGRVYHKINEENEYNLKEDEEINSLISEIRKLENDLKRCDQELEKLKASDDNGEN